MRKATRALNDMGAGQSLPGVLQIQIQPTKNSPLTINLDLAGILGNSATHSSSRASPKPRIDETDSVFGDNNTTLVEDTILHSSSKAATGYTTKNVRKWSAEDWLPQPVI